MAGKARHLRQRGTTFFVRIGVPKELREIVGKSELHESLGGTSARLNAAPTLSWPGSMLSWTKPA